MKDFIEVIEVIALKSFIGDQMLIVRQSRKDSTLQKSPCDDNSEIARLTEEIPDLCNENRTKSCIIQILLENDNTQQKPPATNKSDFIVPNKYVRNSKNNTIIVPARIYVLHKITIALKFMSYINSDLQIHAKKLQTPG